MEKTHTYWAVTEARGRHWVLTRGERELANWCFTFRGKGTHADVTREQGTHGVSHKGTGNARGQSQGNRELTGSVTREQGTHGVSHRRNGNTRKEHGGRDLTRESHPWTGNTQNSHTGIKEHTRQPLWDKQTDIDKGTHRSVIQG